ncbi:hypothetical protein V500_03512 [Pseudogymnoascus sp. VKM F-4518 (FW-2643)]|nr:hypothetical protein V500_03512 [Pseudogymnoascus sp. VKM F-4518 (FW-2643)]
MAATRDLKFDMIRRLRLADYVTLSNALCGVLSVFCSMQRYFVIAHVLIFLGYEFDRFDGIVARWRNECSELGKQLDSLSDLITFGMAPIIMLYSVGFRTPVDQLVLGFYALCGVSRLARFNVVAQLVPKDAHGKALYHEGLAIPFAALIVSTTVAVSTWMGWTSEDFLLTVLFPAAWCEFHPVLVAVMALGAMMSQDVVKMVYESGLGIMSNAG